MFEKNYNINNENRLYTANIIFNNIVTLKLFQTAHKKINIKIL